MNKQAKVSNSYVGSIGLYKRIVNADTRSIRIANADGQGGKPLRLQSLIALESTSPLRAGTF